MGSKLVQSLIFCSFLVLAVKVDVNHCGSLDSKIKANAITYPPARRNESFIEDYFGTKVADPYRWMEEIDSVETKAYVVAQQNFTKDFMDKIPSRDVIRKRLTQVWNYPKSSSPEKVGTKYYSFKNTGLQNQNIMYVQEGLKGNTTVFLDPNTFSKDGTVALDSFAFSKDGLLLVYAITQSGSDWKTISFKNVTSGLDLKDVLLHSKWPSLTWSHDNKGIFYSRYLNSEGETSKNGKIYYHTVGTSQDEDFLVSEFPIFPERILYCEVTDDGNYLIIGGEDGYDSNSIHVASLAEGIDKTLKDRVKPVFESAVENSYSYITNNGTRFLFQTNRGAPNFRLVNVDITANPIIYHPFLNEDPKNAINWVSIIDTNKFLISYLEDVKNTLELRRLTDASLIQKFDLEAGSVTGLTKSGREDNEFFFNFQSFLAPGTIHRCEISSSTEKATCSVFYETQINGLNLADFIQEQKFYPSKDKTLIPMYIVRHKNVKLDGTAPTLLYGYGGFNLAQLPTFSVKNLAFVDGFTGIYVLANLRGGSEYGEKWHQGGMMNNKQNVFDDFHSAAEYLIQNKYTSSSKLTIHGRSNGGLLVGACVNQRPDLYATGIAQVGVMDMLRFQYFTIGYAWCAEYGCSDNEQQFKNLIKYSPLHNLRFPASSPTQQYPAVLVTTGDHDDRVVPAHSFKYAAELQHAIGKDAKQTNPLLLRVDVDAGHGAGKPTAKEIDEFTDIFAFIGETQSLTFTVPDDDDGDISTSTVPGSANSIRDISTFTLYAALSIYILKYFIISV